MYHFTILYSVYVPPKLHLTRISQTKQNTSVSNACIGFGKPDEVLNDESERNINLLLITTIYHQTVGHDKL